MSDIFAYIATGTNNIEFLGGSLDSGPLLLCCCPGPIPRCCEQVFLGQGLRITVVLSGFNGKTCSGGDGVSVESEIEGINGSFSGLAVPNGGGSGFTFDLGIVGTATTKNYLNSDCTGEPMKVIRDLKLTGFCSDLSGGAVTIALGGDGLGFASGSSICPSGKTDIFDSTDPFSDFFVLGKGTLG